MRASNRVSIRALLRAAPDGMEVAELATIVGVSQGSIGGTLRAMPDAYIDRWKTQYRYPPRAVWCVVIPPEDCPRPS